MKISLKYREIVGDARRIVVKIGSRVLVQKNGRPDGRRMKALTRQLAALHKAGREVVVVTSGAVGAGMEALKLHSRPTTVPDLQMAAAVGQTRLMSRYDALFSSLNCKVGQVLLTHDDFRQKIRLTNARRTLENLLRHDVIPIINENDVVADEEIRADLTIGDNDNMAALVVKLMRADLLILLTTVNGLREPTAAGRTRRVRYIENVTRSTFALVSARHNNISKGGMGTKLKAAQSAAKVGCSVVIADGRKDGMIRDIMDGRCVGTMILASGLD